mmetsp:Transcript_6637/g.14185  ORF Transcript_6637/g.14185 Transcript_6637/m.14185 type:complete len:92 (+) Transcript_6637:1194-1469(+)
MGCFEGLRPSFFFTDGKGTPSVPFFASGLELFFSRIFFGTQGRPRLPIWLLKIASRRTNEKGASCANIFHPRKLGNAEHRQCRLPWIVASF